MNEELGYTSINTGDGLSYRAPLEDYVRIAKQWMDGAAFLEFRNNFGAHMVLKSARIEAIVEITPEVYEAQKENERLTALE
jgi:hypothetical protein